MPRLPLLALLVTAPLVACASTPTLPPGAECFSLAGEPLVAPPLEDAVRARRQAELDEARAALARTPDDPDALIWVGRRLGYLGRYREALEVFEQGCERFPADPRFPRHSGHRLITLRRFAAAERALEHAVRLAEGRPDEIEPAGLPNADGVEIDWLQHSIWYHLALARFLQDDLEGAEQAWTRCLEVSRNPDAICSAANWLYVTLRRQGDGTRALALVLYLPPDLDVVEYQAYRDLVGLYRGELDADRVLASARAQGGTELATVGYALASWQRAEGRPGLADELLREIVAQGAWPAFGHIAAEVDLARDGR